MKFLRSFLAGGLLVLSASYASAQDYPTRQIMMIVPVPAGGAMDSSARRIGKLLGDRLGQSVVVDNKPGAGGVIGTEFVARSKADGYTILYSTHASARPRKLGGPPKGKLGASDGGAADFR